MNCQICGDLPCASVLSTLCRECMLEDERGATDERAAIVAWLRQQGAEGAAVVGAIERGVHLGSPVINRDKTINEPPGIAAEPPGICERPVPDANGDCQRCELSEDDHKYATRPTIITPGNDSTPSIGTLWTSRPAELPPGAKLAANTGPGREWPAPSAEPDRPDGEE